MDYPLGPVLTPNHAMRLADELEQPSMTGDRHPTASQRSHRSCRQRWEPGRRAHGRGGRICGGRRRAADAPAGRPAAWRTPWAAVEGPRRSAVVNNRGKEAAPAGERRPWFTPGVGGIGAASLLADVGHEIPTSLLPSFVTATLGAPASALGLIEGISEGLAGAGWFVGGALADDPRRRRAVAVTRRPRSSRR